MRVQFVFARVAAVGICLASMLWVGAQEAGADQATDDYNFAAWLYNDGKYGLAAESYQAFLDSYAGHTKAGEARFGLAQSLFHLQKFAEAATQYEKLCAGPADFSQMPEVLFQFAQSRAALERFDLAEKTFAELSERYPEHYLADWALARRAACLLSTAKTTQAETLLDTFLARYAPGDQLPKKVAATRDMLAKLKEADIDADDAFLGLIERSVFHRAVVSFNAEKYGDAQTAFESFLTRYPKSDLADEAAFRLAQALYQQEQFGTAAERYRAVGDGKSDFAAPSAFERGLALYKAGDLKGASGAFADMAARFSEHEKAGTALLYAGTFLYEAGDYRGAVERLRPIAGSESPSAVEAAYWLGMGLLKEGKPAEAEQVLFEALERFAKSDRRGDMLLGLADARLAQDKAEPAAEAFARYARDFHAEPQAAGALYAAAVALHRAEKYAEADGLCDELLKTFSRDVKAPQALFLSGENRFLQKQYDAAEKRYLDFLARKDTSAEPVARAHFRLAWIHRYAARFDKAIEALSAMDRDAAGEQVAAEADYLHGVCLFETGAYGEVDAAFDAYLKGADTSRFGDDALLKLAVGRLRDGRLKEAAQTFERLLKDYAGSEIAAQARYQLAECYYDLKDYAKAVRGYRAVLSDDKAADLRPYAMFGIAQSHYDQQEWAAAAQAFGELADADSDSALAPQALLGKGRSHMQEHKWSDAALALRALLDAHAGDELARPAAVMLGTCLQEQGKWDEAASVFGKIVTDYPRGDDMARLYYELAWSRREANKEPEALQAFEELVRQYPKAPLAADAYFHLAEARYLDPIRGEDPKDRTARLDAARELYEKVLAVTQNGRLADKAYYRIGWCLSLTAQHERAAQMFDKVADEFPKSDLAADALFQSAQAHALGGSREKAIERYSSLVESTRHKDFENIPEVYVGLGDCLAGLNRTEDAIRYLTVVTTRFPDRPAAAQAFFLKGKALYEQQKYAEALDNFQNATRRTKAEEGAKAQFYIGQVYQAQSQLHEALKAYLRVMAIHSRHREWAAAASYESGKCYEALEQWNEAREAYDRVLGDYKDTQWAEPATARRRDL